jgi:DNA-binding MarR family transcriptional regulator
MERATRWMFARIVASLTRTLRDEELRVAQLAALLVIDEAGELRQAALAGELALSPSAASRMVDGLVQRGLVERREAPDDRRARTLRLSPRGAELLDDAGHARVELVETVLARIPRTLVRTFLDNVERVRAASGRRQP